MVPVAPDRPAGASLGPHPSRLRRPAWRLSRQESSEAASEGRVPAQGRAAGRKEFTLTTSTGSGASPQAGHASLAFPTHALVGSLGDLARTLARGTEVPEEFYFACGVTILGAACGTDLGLNIGIETEPRFYTVLLGESYDVRKSTAQRRSIAALENQWATRGLKICYGVGSAEGLARELGSVPDLLLSYDELSTFVDKSKVRDPSSCPWWRHSLRGTTGTTRPGNLNTASRFVGPAFPCSRAALRRPTPGCGRRKQSPSVSPTGCSW